ncbi:MAG: hypothetical protein GY812_00985 [Actinomycetia bacterium]|nr:hypothetical protein [Actinomycetes bacterium]
MSGPGDDPRSAPSDDDRPPPLPDGAYDVFVVNADDLPTDGGTTTALELTITSGEHRSETMALTAPTWLGEPVELIGMPATLTVADGAPSVRIDS